jgi:hypothetical protein
MLRGSLSPADTGILVEGIVTMRSIASSSSRQILQTLETFR